MTTLLFTLAFFLLMAALMAVGVLAGREPIKGSCGGMSALLDNDCPVCGGDAAKCESSGGSPAEPLGYDVMSERR